MKQRTLLITATALIAIAGGLLTLGGPGLSLNPRQEQASVSNSTSAPPPPPSQIPQSTVGLPKQITIPKINVNANFQYVGTTEDGQMDVPSNGTDVAWYEYGARPGEEGNSVIAGHLDTYTSRTAVFTNLKKLVNGDDIYVTDENGKKYHFQVTKNIFYSNATAPVKEIFGPASKSHLILITCGGAWDRKAGTYSQREVVYADLIDDDASSDPASANATSVSAKKAVIQ
jgi:LPXTG-site transpeptidase (sortase) family protein